MYKMPLVKTRLFRLKDSNLMIVETVITDLVPLPDDKKDLPEKDVSSIDM